MYCSECGAEAAGKFCAHCGTPLAASPAGPAADFDWRESCDFEQICKVAEVHRRIEAARHQAGGRVSGTQVLELVDTLAAPLMGGLSSVAMAKITKPMTTKLGLKTGKDRREFLMLPPGVVLANIAVALAEANHTITAVEYDAQRDADRATIEATVEADLRGMEAKLAVAVERGEAGTWVIARARIDGQWYDWGKCQKRLDQLFANLRTAA